MPTKITTKASSRATSTKREVNTEVIEDKKNKKTFDPEDGILCRSVTVGGLWLDGVKSKNVYRWVSYGDETEVEYRDLVSMVRSKSKYIFAPFFVIDDEDFIDEFRELKKFYSEQYTVEDLKGVLDLRESDMIATIKTLPSTAQNTLKSMASTMIANGELDSLRKIRALDEYFGTELNLLSSLN